MMNSTRGLGILACAALALTATATANAEGMPGDPCSTPGLVKVLGSGTIECLNGSWAPSMKQPSGGPASPTGSAASSATAAKIFTSVGPVLTQDTFASTAKQVADPSAVRLPDGRVRIFAWVNPTGLRTATSTDQTGTTFVADATNPLPTMAGQPRVVRVDATSVRLFTVAGGNINAAISHDNGITFADEGPVITTAQAGFEPGTLSLVKQGRQYRAYFSNLEKPGERAARVMKTATSTDMLQWTVGPTLSMSGSLPFALINAKGRIALYYAADRGTSYGVFVSTSKNGTSFSKEKLVMAGAGDPDIISAGKNRWLMYYGTEVSPAMGFGVMAAKSIGNAIP